MPSEIILPAGTEFVETAIIPVLIAEALNPKPANEPRLGRQTESDSAEVKSAAFRRYQVEREHGAMMCCAIDDGTLKALSSSSRRRVTVHEPDSIVMVSELAKYVEQFGISVNVTDKTKAAYRQAAYVQAAYDETGLNGNAINWRYWVHQLPVISAAQAACLMSALEPDLFANLDGRNWQDNPARIDPARNIEKARKIQRLAEAQGKLTASPVEWVGWAQAQSLEVHTGFLLAVEELPETTSVQGDAAPAAKSGTVKRSISKGEVINAFDGFHFSRDRWDKSLGDPPDWLKTCRVEKGKQGDNKASARWNPVLIAVGLLDIDKELTPKKLDAVFVTLKDWREEWLEQSANDRKP